MIKLPEGRRCYNAGKISGLNYLGALAKFRKFDEQIYSETGMHPVNPMVHGLKPCRPCVDAHAVRPPPVAPLRCGILPTRLGGKPWSEDRTLCSRVVRNGNLSLSEEP